MPPVAKFIVNKLHPELDEELDNELDEELLLLLEELLLDDGRGGHVIHLPVHSLRMSQSLVPLSLPNPADGPLTIPELLKSNASI